MIHVLMDEIPPQTVSASLHTTTGVGLLADLTLVEEAIHELIEADVTVEVVVVITEEGSRLELGNTDAQLPARGWEGSGGWVE